MTLDLSHLSRNDKMALFARVAAKEHVRRANPEEEGSKFAKYANAPGAFITEAGGEFIWSKQQEICDALLKHDHVAIHSCHQSGKSYLLARIIAWFISIHQPGDAFAVTSAPTFSQVRAILWRELNRVHHLYGLPGKMNQTEWSIKNELVAFGRKPADEEPTAFQGLHALNFLVAFDEGCHDDQTDVLTYAGWKRFADLTPTDTLLTMDPDTGQTQYNKPMRLYRAQYDGKMYEYKSRNANFCVTPDHDMWVKRYDYATRTFYGGHKTKMSEMAENKYLWMERHVNWKGYESGLFRIVPHQGARKYYPSRDVDANDWFTLLGWWFSEGHIVIGKKGIPRCIGITQYDPVVRQEISDLCSRLGLEPYTTGKQVMCSNGQIAAHFAKFGDGCIHKRIPAYVRMASPRLINLFLDTFVRGDGYSREGYDILYTSNTGMKDDLQEMILKSGSRCAVRPRPQSTYTRSPTIEGRVIKSKHPGWVISRTQGSARLKYRPQNVKQVDYKGEIFCATVPPHHIILTRRDGYVLWSGNCGLVKNLYDAAESLIANVGGKFIVIGNPDDPNTEFGRICKPGSGWHVIHISAFDTPNLTGEKVPDHVRKRLVSKEWVEERAKRWGITSPIYQSKVLGEFPDVSEDSLIEPRYVAAAMARELEAKGLNELGVDVARFGRNESVIYHRIGPVARLFQVTRKRDLMHLCGEIVRAVQVTGAMCVKIDDAGMGGGVTDRLNEIKREDGMSPLHNCNIVPVNVGMSATERVVERVDGKMITAKQRFSNLKAEITWQLRDLFVNGEIDLGDDEDTQAQATAIKYGLNSRGLIVIESKEDMEKRLGGIGGATGESGSPDRMDALILCMADVEKSMMLNITGDVLHRSRFASGTGPQVGITPTTDKPKSNQLFVSEAIIRRSRDRG